MPYSRGFPNPGIESQSPTLQADSLPAEPPGKPNLCTGDIKTELIVQKKKKKVELTTRWKEIYITCNLIYPHFSLKKNGEIRIYENFLSAEKQLGNRSEERKTNSEFQCEEDACISVGRVCWIEKENKETGRSLWSGPYVKWPKPPMVLGAGQKCIGRYTNLFSQHTWSQSMSYYYLPHIMD